MIQLIIPNLKRKKKQKIFLKKKKSPNHDFN